MGRSSHLLGFVFLMFASSCFALVIFLSQFHLVDPPVILKKPDFSQFEDSDARKQAFFDFLTPMIQDQNQRILAMRGRLQMIHEEYQQYGNFSPRSSHYIQQLTRSYRFDDEELTTEQQLDRLLRRVDIIPLPLALAQAASESGWGSSRFAQEANNFFGQWCYVEGCGVVPNQRPTGATHEVAKFANVRESINSYFYNINTYEAYQELRNRRQQVREAGGEPRSEDLIPTLLNYSERRGAYLDDLRQIIRVNELNRLESSE
jgi:Bax protein